MDQLQESEAVHAGHFHVADDQVRAFGKESLDPFDAVNGFVVILKEVGRSECPDYLGTNSSGIVDY
jgi:hypothetical protein